MTTKSFSQARIDITAKDKSKAAFSTVQKSMKSVTSVVFSLQSAIVSAAGIGGMGLLIKSSMEAADNLAKTSDRLGVTTKSLAGMRHAASLAGMENSALDKSLEKLSINLSKAVSGSGAAAEALAFLGLEADKLAMLPTDEALAEIADSMTDVVSASDRARLAQDLFGRSGLEMVNVMAGGSEALKDAAAEAEAFGTAISRVDAAQIEAANDAMYRAKQAVAGIGMSISVALSPYIEAATNLFVDAAKEADGWKDEIVSAVESIITGIAYLLDIIHGLQFAWQASQFAFAKMAEMIMKGVEKIAKPIVKLLSIIPKLGVDYEKTMLAITEATDVAVVRTDEMFQKMDDIARSGSYSETVKEFFADIKEASELNAIEVAEIQEASQEAQRASQGNHLYAMFTNEQKNNKKIIKEKKETLTDLEKFMAASYVGQTALVTGEMEKMTRGVAQSNRAMFEINKIAGIANAMINAHQAAAMALGAYPPPIGMAMAALSYAAGLAQVNAIRSTSFGGGGGSAAPSLSGGAGSGTPVYDPDTGGGGVIEEAPQFVQERKDITINLSGVGYSKTDVRELIYMINEEVGDGVELRVTI